MRFIIRLGGFFIIGLGLLAVEQAIAVEIAIKTQEIYVNGKALPFGKYSDSAYDEILGPHSHKGTDAALYWENLGVMVQRRARSEDCSVFVRIYLNPKQEDRYLGPERGFVKMKAFSGNLTIENTPIKYDTSLSKLKSKTKKWAVPGPFGYTYLPAGLPATEVLVYIDYQHRKQFNGFVDVMRKDFEEICGVE